MIAWDMTARPELIVGHSDLYSIVHCCRVTITGIYHIPNGLVARVDSVSDLIVIVGQFNLYFMIQ